MFFFNNTIYFIELHVFIWNPQFILFISMHMYMYMYMYIYTGYVLGETVTE
jgi:hypothetical protein